MEIIRKALEEFRGFHLSEYPENIEHEKKCNSMLEHMSDKDKEIYALAKEYYHQGQKDAWECPVD